MKKFVKAVFHKDIRAIEFTADNGDRMLRSGGTLAWLFNNPGNLRPKSKSLYPGQIGTGDTKYGKLCIFSSVEAGRAEKRALLRRKYNPMTLRKAIYTYAPPNDNNDSEAYLSFVKKKTGFSDDVLLQNLSDEQMGSLMAAMEQMEGFNAKKETRKEKWVHVTNVTVSDGARPIQNQPIVIKRGGNATEAKTDLFGRLPPFVTVSPGEVIDLLIKRGEDALEKIAEFVLPSRSQSLVLYRSGEEYRGVLASHNPLPANKPKKPGPIRYVIQPGDTMDKIAKRFKTSVGELMSINKGVIRNPNRIYPGQVIWIHGQSAPASKGKAMSPAQSAQTRPARSKEDKGHPLGIVLLDQKRAPWMEIAIAELKKWGGTKESVIDDTTNYHQETGASDHKSMEGTNNAWCASFVNYCLKQAGYSHTGSPSSQSFVWSKQFKKIDSPVYGAIVVYQNPRKKGTGHVAFVYCALKGGDLAVLGGNQGDTIKFNSHKGVYLDQVKYELRGFYVPLAYASYAEKQLENGGDLGAEQYTLSELRAAFKKESASSAADLQTR